MKKVLFDTFLYALLYSSIGQLGYHLGASEREVHGRLLVAHPAGARGEHQDVATTRSPVLGVSGGLRAVPIQHQAVQRRPQCLRAGTPFCRGYYRAEKSLITGYRAVPSLRIEEGAVCAVQAVLPSFLQH